MKGFIAVAVVAVMVFSVCGISSADTAVDKLGRGLANVVTSPLEITKGMSDEGEANGMFAGVTVGLLKGAFNTVKRAVVGVFEVATFPVPVPEGYKPIIDDPEFFMQDKNY